MDQVQKGTFREDLFYRLNVVNIEVPPLRDRRKDIVPIAENLLKKYSVEYLKPNSKITEKAMQILVRHSWPGNIRELENIIQRSIIMSEQTIKVEDLPKYLKYPEPREKTVFQPLKEIEKAYILKVLASVDNNKTKAAEILQIDRKTLRQKLK